MDDACFTFEKMLLDGRTIPAAEIHALSLANLSGKHARIVRGAEILASL